MRTDSRRWPTSLRSAGLHSARTIFSVAQFSPDGAVLECRSDHIPNLAVEMSVRGGGIKTLRREHLVGKPEHVRRWVTSDSVLLVGWKAEAQVYAQLGEQRLNLAS
jgi:hypothetical protein